MLGALQRGMSCSHRPFVLPAIFGSLLALVSGCAIDDQVTADDAPVTTQELSAPGGFARPTQVLGQFVTLHTDSDESVTNLVAAVNATAAEMSSGGHLRPGWKGIQFELYWPGLADASGSLTASGTEKLVAVLHAADAAGLVVNFMFKWHGFSGRMMVPSGGAARQFHAVAKNEYSVAIWDAATLSAYRHLVASVGDLIASRPEARRAVGVGFAETACSGCADDTGYTALALENGVKALALTSRRHFPAQVEVNVYANFFPVEPNSSNARSQSWYVYDFMQWGSCGNRYVGVGAPDARRWDIPSPDGAGGSCHPLTTYSPPLYEVMNANGGALIGVVSESLSQQIPDFEVPNTAASNMANAVGTLRAAQVVWSDFHGATGTACGDHGYRIDDVFPLVGTVPVSNDPTWVCITAVNPYR